MKYKNLKFLGAFSLAVAGTTLPITAGVSTVFNEQNKDAITQNDCTQPNYNGHNEVALSFTHPRTKKTFKITDCELQGFREWVESDLREEALSAGISEDLFDSVAGRFQPSAAALYYDSNQPEGTITLREYLNRYKTLRDKAPEVYKKNQSLVEDIEAETDVPAEFLIAIYGMETAYGSYMGSFNVLQSTMTLGYPGFARSNSTWDKNRTKMFKKQFLSALRIVEEGHVKTEDFTGGWAGAFGRKQFMPDTFLRKARDWDGDGKIDLYNNLGDAMYSAATLLKDHWNPNQSWGRQIKPNDKVREIARNAVRQAKARGDRAPYKLRFTIRNLERFGYDIPLPESHETVDDMATLLFIDGPEGDYFIIKDNENYHAIRDHYNNSGYYAIAAGLKADVISSEFKSDLSEKYKNLKIKPIPVMPPDTFSVQSDINVPVP